MTTLERWKKNEILKQQKLNQLKQKLQHENEKILEKTKVKFKGPVITQLPIEKRYEDVIEKKQIWE